MTVTVKRLLMKHSCSLLVQYLDAVQAAFTEATVTETCPGVVVGAAVEVAVTEVLWTGNQRMLLPTTDTTQVVVAQLPLGAVVAVVRVTIVVSSVTSLVIVGCQVVVLIEAGAVVVIAVAAGACSVLVGYLG